MIESGACRPGSRGLRRPGANLDQFRAEGTLRDFGVMRRLCPKPIAVGQPEKTTKPQIGVGGDAALAGDARAAFEVELAISGDET